jgi:hypothetical protein
MPSFSFSMRIRMSRRRRPFERLWGAAFAAFLGLNAFIGVASRFETIHTLDVLRLMIAGAAIPVTIMMLIQFFNPGLRSEDNRAGEKRGEEST